MSMSTLPLSYCTNVHPGRTVAEVEAGLDRYTLPIAMIVAGRLAAGLWLAKPVVDELLSTPDGVERFANGLTERDLTCHTLNAFPFGDFHSARVKENVYLPDWSQPQRAEYTIKCAQVLAALLPDGADGSISTLPLGFNGFDHPGSFVDTCIGQVISVARQLDAIHQKTGKMIRLAIEPEPFCLLETTDEAIGFFRRLRNAAAAEGATDAVQAHIGLCFDVCHQAVEYENIADAISRIDAAGIRINKAHLSCAIQLDHPANNAEGRAALAKYVEPRYLHQTLARSVDGRISRLIDLSDAFLANPPPEFLAAESWRVHFHVPVDADRLGSLGTTRPSLHEALPAIDRLSYAPHLEIETYTWEVLPHAGPADLIKGLAREITATETALTALRTKRH